MVNSIDRLLGEKRSLGLMTHVVAGYPDLETSARLVETLAAAGSDLIEIQVPFSDPLADGPSITAACHLAVTRGVTPADCFALASYLGRRVKTPLLLMTYANIPFQMGLNRFIRRSAAAGISALIIPDLPFDDPGFSYPAAARRAGLHPILLLSPGMREVRVQSLLEKASGFVYATLRVGNTGARRRIDPSGLDFLASLRQATCLPLGAGFGISSPHHADLLRGRADIAIVGSHLIDLLAQEGLEGVDRFVRSLRQTVG